MLVINDRLADSPASRRPAPVSTVGLEPVTPVSSAVYAVGKVAFDFTAALALLIVAAPVILVACLLVKLTSRGPVFYSQVRVGRYGRPFRLYKIRTMVHECESLTGARWCLPGDPRITPVGAVLRKTHLDELPQLWNVLRGEMSLVGPRPERPEFLPELVQALPNYLDRLQVRPGLTGLAQVQLPPDSDLESVRRKLACDLHYVAHTSLWLDLRLVLVTAFAFWGVPYHRMCRLCRIPNPLRTQPAEMPLAEPTGVPHLRAA